MYDALTKNTVEVLLLTKWMW